MRVLCAPDGFKGTCTAAEVARALAAGVRDAGHDPVSLPLADGGEGTADVLTDVFPTRVACTVTGPVGQPVAAFVAFAGATALVESALACGLPLVPESSRQPGTLTTRGVGELIGVALDHGAERVILSLGGSATCDGGVGMAAALGLVLRDGDGNAVEAVGDRLLDVASVDRSGLHPRLARVVVEAWCDVDVGLRGAGEFLAQKGARDPARLVAGLEHLRALLGASSEPGDGAAGGLGFGARALLGARLLPGASAVLDHLDADALIASVQLVLTGEGRLDATTARGKLIDVLASRAASAGVPVVAVCGRVEPGAARALGIEAIALGEGTLHPGEAARTPEALRRAARTACRSGAA